MGYVPCEYMKKIGVIVTYMQPEVVVLCEKMKNRIGVMLAYMKPGVLVLCEDMKIITPQNELR